MTYLSSIIFFKKQPKLESFGVIEFPANTLFYNYFFHWEAEERSVILYDFRPFQVEM